MMARKRVLAFVAPLVVALCAGLALAQEEKEKKEEVTVTGKVVCAACALKLCEKCAVGIDAGAEKYILVKNDLSKKLFPRRYDLGADGQPLTAKVTGTVEVKGKGRLARNYLTATKIEVSEPPKDH